MRFQLNLQLGNDKMRTSHHVAQALRKVAAILEAGHAHPEEDEKKILDINGNSCGKWEFTDQE